MTQDSAWLAARAPVCAAAFNTGGTIDGISAAACLLEESNARLAAVKGITPPEARLKGTDSTDPNQLSWYTTPEGSRIAEINTQGDQTGGAVVAWVIVGGANGFVVNPKQFYFQDGSFTDPGVPEPSTPPTTASRPARSSSSPSTTPSWPRTRMPTRAPRGTSTRRAPRSRSGPSPRAGSCPAARPGAGRCAWPARSPSPSG